jgi:hypothetical protein
MHQSPMQALAMGSELAFLLRIVGAALAIEPAF